jgi:hypothetical protein
VTSSPLVAAYLSNLPAYRTGVSPLLRGVEIGLAHGFLVVGPFIKLGPLRNVEGVAEIVGCLNGAALVLILTACLSIYGAVMFEGNEGPQVCRGRPQSRMCLPPSICVWTRPTAAVAGTFGVGGSSCAQRVGCSPACTSPPSADHACSRQLTRLQLVACLPLLSLIKKSEPTTQEAM